MDIVIPCPCPAKDGALRHETDTVTLREQLDFFGAASIRNAVIVLQSTRPGSGTGETMAVLARQYLLRGVESWTLVDDKAKPVPVADDTICDFMDHHIDAAMMVSDAADGLYQAVMLPLILRAFSTSPPSPTESPTSRTNGSQRKRPTRSRPSSTSTFPTADTAMTSSSLDGDSRLSQSSA